MYHKIRFYLAILSLAIIAAISACSSDKKELPTEAITTEPAEPELKDGWVTENNDIYYYKEGVPRTGWLYYHRSKYYFDHFGKMVTGWAKIDDNYYYFAKDGKMRSQSWFEDETGRYYLTANGTAATGIRNVNGTRYLFSQRGTLLKNQWHGNYYAGEDGAILTDTCIDGLWVDQDGKKICDGTYGNGGCLFIPSLGIQVPVYKTPGGEKGQAITDRSDSAAYLTTFHMPLIADHKNQGFEAIKDSSPGETVAFLLTKSRVSEYLCSDIFIASNVEKDILDENGKSIDDYDTDFALYTCNENWHHVTVVLFRKYH